ncbi:hypothetical protein HKX54_10285 [Sulfitobacter sp. M57]|uniref:hypothetical protein n=1 Tax=unclassified Sulfitobacter TaxID=196795 RepID=UPI0023E30710|nr:MULTISPECIES: hypothetical protein [unclassified Sulfitobacter]MDF3414842.1 hypothetical protein [Sulfitobacter sp. KE5]MDF3422323.1 hypothetical protein [Sulfitobacter sp. KE43]MDF3433388.1 hypothetical protein [Sulfitobacter sp. KE42]MDF3459028.1 hypothetical protein [Sulfitobacter sp. S74]MDF3462927.1 hypothetical protein [Sulfitobacter sp. Ks18]
MTNVTDSPREIALAAAHRLKASISQDKHDLYLLQAMRSAHLVVMQSGILKEDASPRHRTTNSLTIH